MDALVLLIGGNPLPNFIAASYFLRYNINQEIIKSPDRLYLIHSKQTEIFAQTIQDLLVKKGFIDERSIVRVYLEERPRDMTSIASDLEDESILDLKSVDSVNFFFTGGTKPMVLQTYITLKSIVNNKTKLILSDLDPINHKISCYVDGHHYLLPKSKDLCSMIMINVDDLFELHNCDIIHSSKKISPYFSKEHIKLFLKNLENVTSEKAKERGRKWQDQWKDLVKQIKKKNGKYVFKKDALDEDKNFKQLDAYLQILSQDGFDDLSTKLKEYFIDQKDSKLKAKYLFKLGKYMMGGWFEEYVFNVIDQTVFPRKMNHIDLKLNIRAETKGGSRSKSDMEIDVIVVIGYQLILISVTTAYKKGIVKGKCFEALYRAEQLGGSHSKVIIVSFAGKREVYNLYEDLKSFRTEVNNIHIFGREDLRENKVTKSNRFSRKIKDILERLG